MNRTLVDQNGNLVAVVNMDEVALVTRVIDKDQEYTAVVMKSGNGTTYAFPIDLVANQLYSTV